VCAGSDAGHDVSKQDAGWSKRREESRTVQPIVVPSSAAPKKKVVEADDEDDSAASLNPPEMKPAAKAKSKTPAPSGSKTLAERQLRKSMSTKPAERGWRSFPDSRPGLKFGKIVIDPGHGGHDTGTIVPTDYWKKNWYSKSAAAWARCLKPVRAEVVYTRKDDTFIPLETRTAIANQGAGRPVRFHTCQCERRSRRAWSGNLLPELHFIQDALEVAARENAVSEKSIHELQDLVKKIALKEKIEESREFASDVQRALQSAATFTRQSADLGNAAGESARHALAIFRRSQPVSRHPGY